MQHFGLGLIIWSHYNSIGQIVNNMPSITVLYNSNGNRVSPQRDVTVLARRAVSATRPPKRPAHPPADSVTDDRRRQTPASKITLAHIRRASNKTCEYCILCRSEASFTDVTCNKDQPTWQEIDSVFFFCRIKLSCVCVVCRISAL